jgi:SEC-C motif
MADNWEARLKTGRNDECPCGSGKKYKKCHLEADEKAKSEALSKAIETSKAKAEEHNDHDGHDHQGHDHSHGHHHEHGGGYRPNVSKNASKQISAPRKTGSA